MLPCDSEAALAQSPQWPQRRFNYRTILRHVAVFGILTSLLVIVTSSVVHRGQGMVHVDVESPFSPQQRRLKRSLAPVMQKNNGGPLVSKYANLTYIENLDIAPPRRLFAIGDIHGCRDDLDALMARIEYDYARGDRLILLGDLTSKGPDSLEVVRRARELNAWCVRGNHDDKVIRIATYLRSTRTGAGMKKEQSDSEVFPEGAVHDPIKKTNKHVDLARQLIEDDQDYSYLAACPMILTMSSLKSIFVHAGLDPTQALDKQEPYFVMNMRSLRQDNSPAKHRKEGVRLWAESWDEVQAQGKAKTEFTKVYYGHAATSKLQLRQYSFGIDTGCVYGGELTAMEVNSGRLFQVPCPMYAEHD